MPTPRLVGNYWLCLYGIRPVLEAPPPPPSPFFPALFLSFILWDQRQVWWETEKHASRALFFLKLWEEKNRCHWLDLVLQMTLSPWHLYDPTSQAKLLLQLQLIDVVSGLVSNPSWTKWSYNKCWFHSFFNCARWLLGLQEPNLVYL